MEKYLNYLLVSLRWLFYYRLSTGQPFIVGERWWKMSKLNLRQQAFADEYIITGNAYQSALKAGYKENYAKFKILVVLKCAKLISRDCMSKT